MWMWIRKYVIKKRNVLSIIHRHFDMNILGVKQLIIHYIDNAIFKSQNG